MFGQDNGVICTDDMKTVDDCRSIIVDFYRDMKLPQDKDTILKELHEQFSENVDCGCARCMILAMNTAEAVVVVEECAKVVPPAYHNAIAGLVGRLHYSRCGCLSDVMTTAEKK